MPGNVRNAMATVTMPATLSTQFVREQGFPVQVSVYRDGRSQREAQADTPQRQWRLAKRLAPVSLAELRAFYEARGGPLEPFFFYDPYETDPPFAPAPAGDAGKYIVRFEGSFEQQSGIARADVNVTLVQVT
jgi:hypothetical protein